jgi:ketosteroid isomerase-like protein
MQDKSAPEIELLRSAFAAFNEQDPDAAFATMSADVVLQTEMAGNNED